MKKENLKKATHRIKNNLQLVNSLLEIQARNYKDLSVGEFHKKSQSRLTTISLVHESIYYENNVELVDIKEYIDSLLPILIEAYDLKNEGFEFIVNVNGVVLSLNKAIPIGLIINELLINSINHAFNETTEKKITLDLNRIEDGKYLLKYSDSGVGFNPRKAKGLGLEIIDLLITQINGNVKLNSYSGTEYKILF